jgi:hypothetical protein
MVFIDLNSPLKPGLDVLDKSWAQDIRNILDDYELPTADNLDPMTLVCVTNYSHHYQAGEPASGAEHLLIRAKYVRHDVDDEMMRRLMAAVGHYGTVPNIDVAQFAS